MTLARNPLPQLNGNSMIKYFFAALLIIAGFAGCGIFKSNGDVKPNTGQNNPANQPSEKKPEHHQAKEKRDTTKSVDIAKKRMEDSLERIYPLTVKPAYTMSVFLPLYLNDPDRDKTQKGSISISQDFFKGMLIAADTLKFCGKDIKIRVYDSENPFLNQRNLDDTFQLTNPDLLIGPLLEKTHLTYLDTLSKTYKVNWVSPLQAMDKCMGSNYYFESTPSNALTGKLLAESIQKKYPNHRILIVSENTFRDNPIAMAFYSSFPNKDSIKIINYFGKPASTFDPGFPLSDSNIVFIPSKNESFVLGVFSKLRISPKSITIYGIYPWLYFKTQEGDLWQKFNIHIATPFHLDYANAGLSNFITSYRKKYKEEPSIWSFIGFDEITFYGTMLGKYGRYFQRYLLNNEGTEMLHNTYKMQPDIKCEGWKNRYINILKFQDYKMVKDSLYK
jgi:ABC-type branched-subunit amino acid transport system substrate-binding protein